MADWLTCDYHGIEQQHSQAGIYNQQLNLDLVETPEIGANSTISFRFQKYPPIVWNFINNETRDLEFNRIKRLLFNKSIQDSIEFHCAMSEANSGRLEEAINIYDDLLKREKDNYLAYYNRGTCKMKLGEKIGNDENLLKSAKQDFEYSMFLSGKLVGNEFEPSIHSLKYINDILSGK